MDAIMRNCQKISENIERRRFQPLSWKERLFVQLHLRNCAPCRNYLKDSKAIDVLLQKYQEARPNYGFSPQEKQTLIEKIKKP